MNLNERISKIIEYSKFSLSEFADEIEVQRSNISHITSGRNKPSLDFLIKIKDRFPELQWDWLIKGNGEMLKIEENEEILEKPKPASLPDLFSLIDADNFGITEREDKIQKEIPRESKISEPNTEKEKISDSQRLENSVQKETVNNKSIKRIVFFYEDGTFETYQN